MISRRLYTVAAVAAAVLAATPAAAEFHPGSGGTDEKLQLLVDAAATIAPITTTTGACNLALNHAGQLVQASGDVYGASTIFILNLAALPADPYTVQPDDLLIAPITAGAAGTWSIPNMPITASAGVVVCVGSSTHYSGGALTLTKVTGTAATNNSIVVLAK